MLSQNESRETAWGKHNTIVAGMVSKEARVDEERLTENGPRSANGLYPDVESSAQLLRCKRRCSPPSRQKSDMGQFD